MRALAYAFAYVMIAGCASLGLTPAKSFDQQLAYGYSTVASVRQSAAQALTTGVIKVEDAKQVQSLADQARSLLDASRGAYSVGDTKTALGRLQLANSVLTQLAVYLQARGVK
jgi:sensor histidine kinase regulating citrate/malate metabolism